MPITTLGSWLPTIDAFIAHWVAVDAFLSPAQFTLAGGYDVSALQLDRAALAVQLAEVQASLNLRSMASVDRDLKRASLNERVLQFKAGVRALLPGSRYLVSLPLMPYFRSSAGRWREMLDDVLNLWTAIDANSPAVPGFTPPLVLGGGYGLAAFTAEKAALEAALTMVTTLDQNLEQMREMRRALFRPVFEKLKEYRLGVVSGLPPGAPLLRSVPRLTPPAGSTPPPTILGALWNPVTLKADLSWEPLDLPSLDYWSIRAHRGPKWRSDEAETIGQVFPPALTFSTDHGLAAPGSSVFLSVFTVTSTGNERRSNVVKVIRS